MRRNFLRGLIICLVPTLVATGLLAWAGYEEASAPQRAVAREQAQQRLSAAVAALAPLKAEEAGAGSRDKLSAEKQDQLKQAEAEEQAARAALRTEGWKPQFRRGIDLAGGTILIYEVKSGDLQEPEIKELADKLKKRIDENDLKNVVVRPLGKNRIEIILPFVGGAGGKEQANEEFVEEVRQKVKQTGVLEFRILANPNDDKAGVEKAVELIDDPASREALADAAAKGTPPPAPTASFNVKAAGDTELPVEYAWVELGKEERETLGLSQEPTKANPDRRLYDRLAAARGKVVVMPAESGGYVLYSREFSKREPSKDEQGKKVEYFILSRVGEGDTLRVVGDQAKVQATYHSSSRDNRGPAVGFTFTAGGSRFYDLTKRNRQTGFNRLMAIIMDGKVVSAPRLNEPLNGAGEISGNFDYKSASRLVTIINSGNLNAELKPDPVSENTIGPTLGQTTIRNGLIAVAASFVAVLLFMLVYYRFAGFVACVALFVNLLLTVGFMVLMNAAFTLPGLAGIVLMLGMAVDANVLIYERLREEREKGATLAAAIRNGYDRALPTIIDTHLTSIFTAIVLYAFGNDALKGFSVSLTVGLIISLFTSLYITRLMFDFWMHKKWLTQLKMLKLFARPKFDFMKIRYPMFALTAFLTVAGLVLFLARGERVLNVDFTQGTAYGGRLAEGKEKSLAELHELFHDGHQLERLGVKSVARNTQAANAIIYDVEFQKAIGNSPTTVQVSLASEPVGATEESKKESLITRLSKLPDYSIEQVYIGDDKFEGGKSRSFTVRTTEKEREVVQVILDRLLRDGNGEPLMVTAEAKPFTVTGPVVTIGFQRADGKPFDPAKNEGVSPAYFRDFVVRALKTGPLPLQAEAVTVNGINSTEATVASLEGRSQRYSTLAIDFSKLTDVKTLLDDPARATEGTAFITETLTKAANAFKSRPVPERLETFDPSLAKDTRGKAFMAILLSWVAILIFLWFRFGSWQFGLAAVICLIHDLCFTLGAVALCHYLHATPVGQILGLSDFKIDLAAVAALLTLVGYSVNDTIVVFDRIREVRGKNPILTPQMINDSVNQTLSRTILAALTVFLVVVVLYIWGGEGVHLFAFVMVMGVIVGTYSSIYIASPLLLIFGEGKPKVGLPGSGTTGGGGDGTTSDRPAENAPVSAIAS
ncbi:MAG: protein translocase subunit SecD [Fimbriiglobus sp.]|nr:protein translocase subunit SecD [Fimbriiglobus sp.]